MNDMLFKPYTLETLHQMLMRWLPVSPQTQEPDQPAPSASEQGSAGSRCLAMRRWRAAWRGSISIPIARTAMT